MSDSFIGTVFGSLTVVGWDGERVKSNGTKLYQVQCSVCKNDPELFGDAIFKSTKFNLVNNGQIPCGCGRSPRWSTAQYRVLISRKAAGRYTAVVPEDAKTATKVSCQCNAEDCGYSWSTTIDSLLNRDSGCKKCAGKLPITEDEAVSKITKICSEKNFRFLGFKNDWKNCDSKLILECHCGRKWSPTYNSAVNDGTGCKQCSKSGYNPGLPGWLYCHKWVHPTTKHSFLKYGITNKPKQRLTQQKRNTKYVPQQIFSIPFTNGEIPPAIEKAISEHKRNNNIPNQVSQDLFPDGFSETLPVSKLDFLDNIARDHQSV